MKRIPIHIIISQVGRLALPERVKTLQKLVAAEKLFSVRRNELQSLLDGAMLKQLKKEIRAAA